MTAVCPRVVLGLPSENSWLMNEMEPCAILDGHCLYRQAELVSQNIPQPQSASITQPTFGRQIITSIALAIIQCNYLTILERNRRVFYSHILKLKCWLRYTYLSCSPGPPAPRPISKRPFQSRDHGRTEAPPLSCLDQSGSRERIGKGPGLQWGTSSPLLPQPSSRSCSWSRRGSLLERMAWGMWFWALAWFRALEWLLCPGELSPCCIHCLQHYCPVPKTREVEEEL